jgi:hypothetical protein
VGHYVEAVKTFLKQYKDDIYGTTVLEPHMVQVELTGNSIYEYIHPLDHEEVNSLLSIQPLPYSQVQQLSAIPL